MAKVPKSENVVSPYWTTAAKVVSHDVLDRADGYSFADLAIKPFDGDASQWGKEDMSPNPRVPPHESSGKGIKNDVLELIGNTPMIRLTRFARYYGLKCDLVAKCEFMNPGGSLKDRIAKYMIEVAEKSGQLKKNAVLIEATSGNTGIGMSLCAALKGYSMVITLPLKMSTEKCNTMQRLGAEIVRTPNTPWNDPTSNIVMAHRLSRAIPNAVYLDQFKNSGNCEAHYYGTGQEIIDQCNGKVDMVVMGVGTGGTITGAAAKLKEKLPNCKIIGVDPQGSALACPMSLNEEHMGDPYTVEGIGYDFIPDTLNRSLVDQWVKCDDKEAYLLARDLIRLEGLLVGGSSGSIMKGALEAAKELEAGQRCVVVLPDSIRNYMTKYCTDSWMIDRGFIDVKPPANAPLSDATAEALCSGAVPELNVDATLKSAADIFEQQHHLPAIPVRSEGNVLEGVITRAIINKQILSGAPQQQQIKRLVETQIREESLQLPIYRLAHMLDNNPFVLITSTPQNGKLVHGIVDEKSLFDYVQQRALNV